jgi:hypothetical protein
MKLRPAAIDVLFEHFTSGRRTVAAGQSRADGQRNHATALLRQTTYNARLYDPTSPRNTLLTPANLFVRTFGWCGADGYLSALRG